MHASQLSLELELDTRSAGRALHNIQRNEDEGRAHTNPYASPVYRRFIQDLSDMIVRHRFVRGVGIGRASVDLIRNADSMVVAYITLSRTMAAAVGTMAARDLAQDIGRALHGELVLEQIAGLAPDLYHILEQDLDARRSHDERHRLTVFKMQAAKHGIPLDKWTPAAKVQVGMMLVDHLVELGMIELFDVKVDRKKGYQPHVRFTQDVEFLVDSITDAAIARSVVRSPLIEQPKPWTSLTEGGFHSPQMQRRAPFAIRAGGVMRDFYKEHPERLSPVLRTLNVLQSVAWKVNLEIFDVAEQLHRCNIKTAEVPALREDGKPEFPFGKDWDKDTATEQESLRFLQWKRDMAEWYTELKLRGTKFVRFSSAMHDARNFGQYDKLYFRYTADFRGRVYAEAGGLNPQGSDLQKALLHFAEGKVLDTPEAVHWFLINGANRYGYDKASLAQRAAWSRNNRDLILRCAADPINHREWLEADAPFQFLAWCMEYRDWEADPVGFASRVPVGMDGSCNGLQNYSAMLRDEVGGRSTNLLALPDRNDIYETVAQRTWELLAASDDDAAGFRKRWLAHGANRKIVKRACMTLPYGSTQRSAVKFIAEDYLRPGNAPEFSKAEYYPAATYLARFVWQAICDTVIKAREAMDWLQQSVAKILESGITEIGWDTPIGSRVAQAYMEDDEIRVRCKLAGQQVIRMRRSKEDAAPYKKGHVNGIAPNLIHSIDASHMALVSWAAADAGIESLAMIHDDFGTHAADCPRLFDIIREQFVQMHEDFNPLASFYEEYKLFGIEPPPMKGGLDLQQVLQSEFFFC